MESTWLLFGLGAAVLYFGFKIVTGIIKKLLFLAIIGAGIWAFMQYIN
ncbi:hypothetical protein [Desulforamulus aquiferis]|uniref:Uncharacterized protein n=1 Tax=Desulforamulus aquiferis TaxID=1397668 RepID=A0AAW7ZF36_9FIRM|nr:hypothetical protein [Desulforamulus aquiferis]MDO7787626.1 hypothetical protein [Desulforamulus aquiferis]RYD02993.1 hypothetical protein N752_21510 [Desulforamulus aquiferis]